MLQTTRALATSRRGRFDDFLVWDWVGQAYRHIRDDPSADVLDFTYAGRGSDNRWNQEGEPTLYLAADHGVAIAEFSRHYQTNRPPTLGDKTVARRIYEIRVEAGPLLDLRDPRLCEELCIQGVPFCFLDRRLARAVAGYLRYVTAAKGILVPSVAFLDDPERWVLVLFLDKLPSDPNEFLTSVENVAAVTVLNRSIVPLSTGEELEQAELVLVESLKALIGISTQNTERVNEIRAKQEALVQELKSRSDNPDDEADTQSLLDQLVSIDRDLTASARQMAADYNREVPRFHDAWGAFQGHFIGFFSTTNPDSRQDIEVAGRLRPFLLGFRESMQRLVNTTQGFRSDIHAYSRSSNITDDMREGFIDQAQAMDRLIAALETTMSGIGDMIQSVALYRRRDPN